MGNIITTIAHISFPLNICDMNSLACAYVLAYIHSYIATWIKLQEMNIIIGLAYEKLYRKLPYLMLKTMVSCRFSHQSNDTIIFRCISRVLKGPILRL